MVLKGKNLFSFWDEVYSLGLAELAAILQHSAVRN